MVLRILGWVAVAWLAGSVIYSASFHAKNYARMKMRALDTEDQPWQEFANKLAAQYQRRTIFAQMIKAVLVVLLLNWLLR